MERVESPAFLRQQQRVYYPGMPALPPGVERYQVVGNGVLMLRLAGGDIIRIIDAEGGQKAEVMSFDAHGKSDLGLLGVAANGRGSGMKKKSCQRR